MAHECLKSPRQCPVHRPIPLCLPNGQGHGYECFPCQLALPFLILGYFKLSPPKKYCYTTSSWLFWLMSLYMMFRLLTARRKIIVKQDYWHCSALAESNYLNHWWLNSLTHICVTRPQCVSITTEVVEKTATDCAAPNVTLLPTRPISQQQQSWVAFNTTLQ